ncbi:hypothetical protein [Phenylobacterium sp.]
MRARGTYTINWRRLSLVLAVVLACGLFWWAAFRAFQVLWQGAAG